MSTRESIYCVMTTAGFAVQHRLPDRTRLYVLPPPGKEWDQNAAKLEEINLRRHIEAGETTYARPLPDGHQVIIAI